jgi:hypothetical protein
MTSNNSTNNGDKKKGIMDINIMIKSLYSKDTSEAYKILLELEQISEKENFLYNYFDEFVQMIDNEKYDIRVRGYRLLCKQAKWDKGNKINKIIDKILLEIEDEKPIAVRMKLKALEDIVLNKKELNGKIKKKILEMDCSKYKDTMQPLILKDTENILSLINGTGK